MIPGPPAQGSRAVVWAGDHFVAVGSGFAISPDGRSWRNAPQEGFPPNGDAGLRWSAVAFDGHQLVAVADSGASGSSGAIAVSARGEHWEVVLPTTAGGLHAVAWGGGRWVAAGRSLFLWSDDGTTWHQGSVESGSSDVEIWSLAFTGSRWVAVGTQNGSAGGVLATSEDGVTWSVDPVADGLFAVASNGVRTVAVGARVAMTSDDGLAWASSDLPLYASLSSLVWTGTNFVGSGSQYIGVEQVPPIVLKSSDGTAWSVLVDGSESGLDSYIGGLAYGDGFLVGVSGGYHMSASAVTSVEGKKWQPAGGAILHRDVKALQAAGSQFVALMIDSVPSSNPLATQFRTDLVRSTDGIHWSHDPIGTGDFNDVAWRDGLYVATGGFDGLRVSDDGVSWTTPTKGLPQHPDAMQVAAGEPGFVVSLDAGMYFSADGVSWQKAPSSGGNAIPHGGLTWAGNRFISAMKDRVATSSDGLHWEITTGSWGRCGFSGFAGHGNRLVGVGGNGLLAWSDGGSSWNIVHGLPDGNLFSVTWDGQEFLVAGAGFILRSTDGIHWSSESAPDTPWFGGIAALGGRTVIAGRGGSLLVRACPGETLDGNGAFRLALPAMANTPGREGTFWSSDLVLHNPGKTAVRVELWPFYDSEGSGGVATASMVVEAGHAVMLQDLLPGLLDSGASSGGAILSADGPLLAASRTFTGQDDATWGQSVPVLPSGDWVEAGQRVIIPGIGQDGAVRTNLGLLNPNGSPLTVHVRFHGAGGGPLGDHSWTVPAWGWRQINLVLEKVGAPPVALAWAELDADDSFVAYASVIDNATGDAITVMPAAPSSGDLVVPAAAHGTGVGGVLWRTDLDLVSVGDQAARYRLELLPRSGPVLRSAERTLAPGHAERLADVIASIFGTSGAGAIRIVPLEGELAANSRTFAVGAMGTFGQAVPAQALGNGLPEAGKLRLVGLSGSLSDSEGFRTNIGAVNLSDQAVTLQIELFSGDGTDLGQRKLDLGPESFGQLTRV
ncbi:MAG: hypothetical protein GXP47_11525, partial [Acidobacteria bacterium]|nr:hypothetical protein [Acidobacteriota bacterium]